MYRYILFDLDGTLTDSREGIFKSIAYSLEKLGHPCPPYETLLRFVGPPLQDSFERYCNMDKELAWKAVETFRERYETIGWAENRAADGVVDLMRRLHERGCVMAIASSKPERSVVPIAEKFGFTPYLAAACGSDGKNEAKVDVIRKAFDRLGIGEAEKTETIMVGDRKFDVEGAAECGIPCVGVEFFDFAPPGEMEDSGALAVCRTAGELEAFLMEEAKTEGKKMELQDILKTVDHTFLKPEATWPQIKTLCDEAVKYGAASVCVAPAHVANAVTYLNGHLPVCTVIGFPNGYSTTYVKCFEAKDALEYGAEEIDMVINLGWVKSRRWEWIEEEIRSVKEMCGEHILKVIIETCLLTDEEKIRLCEVVSNSGADYIKTSTGFGGGGATFEDVALMKAHVRPGLKIKAAGGIASLEDAEKFLELGADRLGTSRVIRAVQALEK